METEKSQKLPEKPRQNLKNRQQIIDQRVNEKVVLSGKPLPSRKLQDESLTDKSLKDQKHVSADNLYYVTFCQNC